MEMSFSLQSKIALGKRLRSCPKVYSLGIKLDPDLYPQEHLELLKIFPKIYYPTHHYEDVLVAMGKKTFPRNYYHYLGNKIKQTELFTLLNIPHPRTQIYYERKRKTKILNDFNFPFVAKIPVGSSQGKGVFLIRNENDLDNYLAETYPAYVQEYLLFDRDLRIVVIGGKVIHAYWRIGREGDFRHNVSQGAEISFENIPKKALEFAVQVAKRCGFDEVGMDICIVHDSLYVLEANMVFGLVGFRLANKDIHASLCELAMQDVI